MKKNLFKGVSVLGAVLLLANVALPGLAYATSFFPITVADITNEALASETYNFTSYADSEGETLWATGAVKVLNKGTVVNVTENYKVDDENGFVGKKFVVKSTEFSENTYYDLYQEDGVTQETNGIKVKISNEKEGTPTTYDFESYHDSDKWGNGTVEVKDAGTLVKVAENYEADVDTFSGSSFYVETANCGENKICQLYTAANTSNPSTPNVYVKILGGSEEEGYAFMSFGDSEGTIIRGIGKIVLESEENLASGWTKVKVVENFMVTPQALTFSGQSFVVKTTSYEAGKRYGLYNAANDITNPTIWIEITGEEGNIYSFKSYSAEVGGDLWGAGKVELQNKYTTVEVKENYAKDGTFENQKFVIYDTTYTDGAKYDLYLTDGTSAGIKVEILEGDNSDGYDFVSYSPDGETKRGNGRVEFVNGFTTVEVTENSIEGFAGNKFVVYATELSASDTVYPLYTTGGDVAGIYVKIEAIPQTTPSSSSNYSGGGGGGSSKSSVSSSNESKTAEKATDTAKADEQKADDAKADENKNEAPAAEETAAPTPMTEAQAVAKFGQEQIDAYKWAHDKGITTMDTVEDARLDEPLTRAELAKMMVVYMVKIANKSPVVTGTVSYPDVKSEELGDLAGYIQLAYQFQIMGVDANGNPIEEFMPNALVTRGEYATVFSRVLFGSLFNQEGEDFYSKHIAALNAAGILTNTDPTIQEMRGWVMLMMYRSSQNLEEIAKVAAEIGATDEEVEAGKKAAEILAEEETKAETTTGDVAEAPVAEEQAQATTGDVAEAPAAQEQAEAATGDVAEVPAVEETASAEANTGEVVAEPSNN